MHDFHVYKDVAPLKLYFLTKFTVRLFISTSTKTWPH